MGWGDSNPLISMDIKLKFVYFCFFYTVLKIYRDRDIEIYAGFRMKNKQFNHHCSTTLDNTEKLPSGPKD